MYQVLKAVKQAMPEVNRCPRCVVMDFETAVWKALQRVFPSASQRGCFFHYTQAVWRNVQAVGTCLCTSAVRYHLSTRYLCNIAEQRWCL